MKNSKNSQIIDSALKNNKVIKPYLNEFKIIQTFSDFGECIKI